MSVQTEIDRIISAVHAAHEAVIAKGGTTSEPYLVANLEKAIETIRSADEATLMDMIFPVYIDGLGNYSPSYAEVAAAFQAMVTDYKCIPTIVYANAGNIGGLGLAETPEGNFILGGIYNLDGIMAFAGFELKSDNTYESICYTDIPDTHRLKPEDVVQGTPFVMFNSVNHPVLSVGTYEPPEPTLQSKTVNPSTSSQTVKPDSGYDGLSQVTVNAMTTATQATPTITVSSAGKITASATQSAGYVAAGTKTATKSLTTQAAKTITPTTSSQTAVASGRYTTGTITVAAIPSNYEDVTTETNEYTALATELEQVINSLPDTGGSGSPTLKSYTLRIEGSASYVGVDCSKVTENGLELVSDDSGEPIKNVAANSYIICTIEPDEAHENYTLIEVRLNGSLYGLFHLWESFPLQIEDDHEGEEIVLSFEYSH